MLQQIPKRFTDIFVTPNSNNQIEDTLECNSFFGRFKKSQWKLDFQAP